MNKRSFLVNGTEYVLEGIKKHGNMLQFSIGDHYYQFTIERTVNGDALLCQTASEDAQLRQHVSRSAASQQQERIQLGALEALVQEMVANQAAPLANQRSPHAPMPGVIRDILVSAGDMVTADQPLIVMEAMKLQTTLNAGEGGIVISIPVAVGDMVTEGTLLVEVGDDRSN